MTGPTPAGPPTSELAVVAGLTARLAAAQGAPADGEVWAGDDAAVLDPAGARVVATVDPVVDGVHLDRSCMSLADAGWKAVARNVSDVVACGAEPWRCLVSVVGASAAELDELYDGIEAACAALGCTVAGGDVASGPVLVVTVTALGLLPAGRQPLLRSGARPGDELWCSGELGWGAAGLRDARAGIASPAAAWFRRPVPSVEAGAAAAAAGATAAMDVSDGLALDLHRLALASSVGIALDGVPVATGADGSDALFGGDDYRLVAAFPPGAARPGDWLPLGRCTADPDERTLAGSPLAVEGWQHPL